MRIDEEACGLVLMWLGIGTIVLSAALAWTH
jgi:hypothetical protein